MSITKISDADEARQWVYEKRAAGKTVGVVPTMGALHEGHLSLANLSRQRCDHTIATIFVNPTQFAPDEDLAKYPRTVQQDCELLQSQSVDAVFVPAVETIYPKGFSTYVDPPEVARTLEGACRPGHFRGVATVVLKLFQIIPATHAFFGRKDYQQLKVIQAMARDLNLGIDIIAGETIRERDGLALSSRNRYLDAADRQRALLLSSALQKASELVDGGEHDAAVVQNAMRQCLLGIPDSHSQETQGRVKDTHGVDKIDYAVIVDGESLCVVDQIESNAVALIAAYIGQTRLIDNRTLLR